MGYSEDDNLTLSAMTLRKATLVDRVKAAAHAGFQGVGWRFEDIYDSGLDEAAIIKLFSQSRAKPVEIEFFRDWVGRDNDTAYLAKEDRLLDLAGELHSKRINVAVFQDKPLEKIADSMKRLCQRAADFNMIVQLEFMPYTPPITSLRSAWDIVDGVAEPNAGLLIDAWHWGRTKHPEKDLVEVPAGRVTGIQLSDDLARPMRNVTEESRHDRLIPGTGALNLRQFLKILSDHGVTAPLSVEVMSDELDNLPPRTAALKVANATRDVLKQAAD